MLDNLPSSALKTVYIQDDNALIELCQHLAKSDVLAIDTEFVRTRTYYPILGLLQVCNGDYLALIDPITINDLKPFWSLISDDKIRKVLHACSEDIEVIMTATAAVGFSCKPVNIIDSQVVMSFLGHGLSMGYAAMIQHFTGVELDKSESRTNWAHRPLTDKQMEYARADVDYLFQVYPKLIAQAQEAGWLNAALEESQGIIERKMRPVDENLLYQQMKMLWRLSPQQLNNLKYLATWRYQRAKIKNLPLSFVAKDHTIMALAIHNPKSVALMQNIEGAEQLDIKHQGHIMLGVLKQANEENPENYPDKVTRIDDLAGYKKNYKKIKAFIDAYAQKSDLSCENFASKKQINQFLSAFFDINRLNERSNGSDLIIGVEQLKAESEILQGWRFRLFGEALLTFALNNFE